MDNSNYWVYFDCQDLGGSLGVATIINDKERSLSPYKKELAELPIEHGTNQFDHVLISLDKALEFIISSGCVGNIFLHHQNKVIIDWLERGYSNANYAYLFEVVLDKIKQVMINGGEIQVKSIRGNENIAKKYCKAIRPKNSNKKLQSAYRKINIDDQEIEELKARTKTEEQPKLAKVVGIGEYRI